MSDRDKEVCIFKRPIDYVPANTSFYCSRCDGGPVNSSDTTTGRFFSQFGHRWNPQVGDVLGSVSDDYPQVIFAMCSDCIKNG